MNTFLVLCALVIVAVALSRLLSYPAIRITKRPHWTSDDLDHARMVKAWQQAQDEMKRRRG